jgi:hypothetical protein
MHASKACAACVHACKVPPLCSHRTPAAALLKRCCLSHAASIPLLPFRLATPSSQNAMHIQPRAGGPRHACTACVHHACKDPLLHALPPMALCTGLHMQGNSSAQAWAPSQSYLFSTSACMHDADCLSDESYKGWPCSDADSDGECGGE